MKRSEVAVKVCQQLGCPILPYLHTGLEFQIEPAPKEERDAVGGYSIRIPENGKSDPIDNDIDFDYHPDYIYLIGTTGWDWRERSSRLFGFDADSIVGHKKPGLPDEEMARLIEAAKPFSYVQINKSKGGLGYQLWVVTEPVETQNHTEHAAVGKAILRQMSDESRYDFYSGIDAKASNMWIAARKKKPGGFEIVKTATSVLTSIPKWYVQAEPELESTELDAEHRRLLTYLQLCGKGEWEAEHKRLRTHTLALKQAHTERRIDATILSSMRIGGLARLISPQFFLLHVRIYDRRPVCY